MEPSLEDLEDQLLPKGLLDSRRGTPNPLSMGFAVENRLLPKGLLDSRAGSPMPTTPQFSRPSSRIRQRKHAFNPQADTYVPSNRLSISPGHTSGRDKGSELRATADSFVPPRVPNRKSPDLRPASQSDSVASFSAAAVPWPPLPEAGSSVQKGQPQVIPISKSVT